MAGVMPLLLPSPMLNTVSGMRQVDSLRSRTTSSVLYSQYEALYVLHDGSSCFCTHQQTNSTGRP